MPHKEKTTEYDALEGKSHPAEVVVPDADETKCPLCDSIAKTDSFERCLLCGKEVCPECRTKWHNEIFCLNHSDDLVNEVIDKIKELCTEIYYLKNDVDNLKRELRK